VISIYEVDIKYEAPYPTFKIYTIEASNFGLAANRAFARFRKDKITKKRQTIVKFTVTKLLTKGDDTHVY
jgi:hypothetical protein